MSKGSYAGHLGLHALAKKRQWRCAYCNQVTHCRVCNPDMDGRLAATRDHRVPRAKGGTNGSRNLVLACFGCNQDKADRLVEQDDDVDWAALARSRSGRTRRATAQQQARDEPSWQACRPDWYKSEQQADNAARALHSATGRRFGSYRCVFCQRWHVARSSEQQSA